MHFTAGYIDGRVTQPFCGWKIILTTFYGYTALIVSYLRLLLQMEEENTGTGCCRSADDLMPLPESPCRGKSNGTDL